MGNEKVSIVIPVYNMADGLGTCLRSIFAQTSDNYEIVIVDDGSTDGTYEAASALLKDHPGNLVLRQENAGSGPARNRGVANATGEYLFFADADDELEPDCVETIAREMRDGCEMLVFGYKSYTKDGKLVVDISCKPDALQGDELRESFDRVLCDEHVPPYKRLVIGAPWNKAFRRDVTVRNALEFPPLRRNQDEVFLMRYMNVTADVKYIKDQLYRHYVGNLEDVWKKYPLDYMDIVLRHLAFRVDIVYGWNRANERVLAYIVQEFTRMTLLAFKQAFNPKYALNYFQKLKLLCSIRSRYDKAFRSGGPLHGGRKNESFFLRFAPVTLLYFRIKLRLYPKPSKR